MTSDSLDLFPVDGLYTWKQKRYLRFIFNKYRRQIKNYQDIAFRLEPVRFDVKVEFKQDLFDLNGTADVKFVDTFKPRRYIK